MTEKNEKEIIDLAYATHGPYLEITDNLFIAVKSDDGGRHLEFSVDTRSAAQFLREAVPHTLEGMRTIIRYSIEGKEK